MSILVADSHVYYCDFMHPKILKREGLGTEKRKVKPRIFRCFRPYITLETDCILICAGMIAACGL